MVCSYGCGQEAKFYLKTVDKWCCNEKWQQCPMKRKNNSESKKGKPRTPEMIEKMRKT